MVPGVSEGILRVEQESVRQKLLITSGFQKKIAFLVILEKV